MAVNDDTVNGDTVNGERLDLLLSREELLYLLGSLNVATIPGLEDDPAGALSEAEQTVALRGAERALRARGLVIVREDGQLVLHNNLMNAVGTCVYGDVALFAFHWAAGEPLPTPLFAHMRDSQLVLHSRPADVLHLFSTISSPSAVVQEIFARCEVRDLPVPSTHETSTDETSTHEFRIDAVGLAQAREIAEQTSSADATARLIVAGLPRQAAEAMAQTLAARPSASNFQLYKQTNGEVTRQELLLLQGEQQNWLVESDPASLEMLTLRTVSLSDVQHQLVNWFAPS